MAFDYKGKSLVGDMWLETGTHTGLTTRYAYGAGFKLLHTVEVNRGHYDNAVKLFAQPEYGGRVHAHYGTSPPFVRDFAANYAESGERVTCWFDAHHQASSGPDGQPEQAPDTQCPLMQELEALFSYEWKIKPVVLIDDSEYFTEDWDEWPDHRKQHYRYEDWPRLQQIKDALPGYEIEELNGILYCVPEGWEGW